MSLADELEAAPQTSSAGVVSDWYEKLDDADKAAVDKWIAAGKSAAGLHRIAKNHGLTAGEESVRKWVAKHRDAS